jgi:hypothetical protein
MKRNAWTLSLAAFLLVGCNVGNAPEPMNEDQLKAAIEKMPPQDQINYINSTPMPAEQKAARIKEIEAKTGYKDPGSGSKDPASGAPKAP